MSAQTPSEKDFDRLFETHELSLRLHARALLPNWDAVDEVMQISSVVMWKKISQLDEETAFLPWSKVIIRFESHKYFRNRHRDPLLFDADVLDILSSTIEEQNEPDLDAEQAALDQCLTALSPTDRELVLAPYCGHGYMTKLAEIKGCTRNSLYKQVRRLRKKLENCVSRQLDTTQS